MRTSAAIASTGEDARVARHGAQRPSTDRARRQAASARGGDAIAAALHVIVVILGLVRDSLYGSGPEHAVDIGDTRRSSARPARRCGPSIPQTRHGMPSAPVDVDLAAVVVVARRRAPSPPGCARAGPCRCARSARPRPSARPGRPRSPRHCARAGSGPAAAGGCGGGRAPRRGRRCRPRPGPAWSISRSPIGAVAARDPRPGPGGVGVGAQRVGAEPRQHLVATPAGRPARRRWRRAGRRTPDRRSAVRAAQPDLADGRGHLRDPGVHVERADQAEVDVDDPVALELARTGACRPTPRRAARCRRASAASAANRPCGSSTRTVRPAKAAVRSRRAGGGCGPQASLAGRVVRARPAADSGSGGSSRVRS